ncbi:MAG: hybrid sensor histidine kinase/response regulator [Desulfobaccales bacterium]
MARYDILLISDGTNLLRTIGWVLEYKGFTVKTTASPEAALEALVIKNYDLVIAKLTTGNLDGLDILKRAKRLNPEVKVVVISGNNEMIFPIEAYEVEVDDYILMPVSPTELWRRVNQCLAGREVVDLEPVRVPAEMAVDGNPARPQMMLMLHDIRNSMVSTAAALKLLARGSKAEMSENVVAKLHEVSDRVKGMIHLTEDFIGKTLSEPRPSKKERDVLDLTEDIVEPVLTELAPEIRDHDITLVNRLHNRQEGAITVRGSRLWLKSVFRNLINNGIRHGGRGCTIMIDFENQGSSCRLNVYNTGQAIPEEFRSMLFSSGPEMRRSRKGRRGMGLGLSLSRDIIQNQGGDIWYEAKSDGSNFVVSLPNA